MFLIFYACSAPIPTSRSPLVWSLVLFGRSKKRLVGAQTSCVACSKSNQKNSWRLAPSTKPDKEKASRPVDCQRLRNVRSTGQCHPESGRLRKKHGGIQGAANRATNKRWKAIVSVKVYYYIHIHNQWNWVSVWRVGRCGHVHTCIDVYSDFPHPLSFWV